MVTINITTSISPEIHKLARDNDISWSTALEEGVKKIVKELEDKVIHGYIITPESVAEKKDKIIEQLQKRIEDLEGDAEVLRVLKNDAVEKNGNGKD